MRGFHTKDVVHTYVLLKDIFDKSFSTSLPPLTEEVIEHIEKVIEGVSTRFGVDPYPGTIRKAAALFYNTNKDHNLFDGNKRLSIIVMLAFIYKRGYKLLINKDTLYFMAKYIASTKGNQDKDGIIKMLVRGFKIGLIPGKARITEMKKEEIERTILQEMHTVFNNKNFF